MPIDDRARCLDEFRDYYMSHYRTMLHWGNESDPPGVAPGDGNAAIFSEPALRALYDHYCKDSVERIYDTLQAARAFLPGGAQSSPGRMLDITCFATTQFFRILFPGSAIEACDKQVKWHDFLEGVTSKVCNLEKDALPYEDESFDLAVFTETLEHIPRSPYAVLGEVKRVLKPGGILVFSVPNLCSFQNRIKLLLGRDILSVDLAHYDTFGHFREYTMHEVEALFEMLHMQVLTKAYAYYANRPPASGGGAASAKWLVTRAMCAMVPSMRPISIAIVRK